MRIAGSDISFATSRSLVEKEEKRENLRVWVDRERTSIPAADKVTISDEMRARLDAMKGRPVDRGEIDLSQENDPQVLIKKLLIEMMSGRKIKIMRVEKGEARDVKGVENGNTSQAAAPEKEGWGLVYDSKDSHTEMEESVFKAGGLIRTSDGVDLNFDLELRMNRTSITENTVNLRAGDAKRIDPLVINFGASSAELTGRKFAFDLNSDGQAEEISFLKPGSGFLAIDSNGDNKVNNGNELFGPSTGDGFAELSAYDSDNNGWIDENDPVFANLKVWTKDSSGKDLLSGLKDKNVGAIYLENASTPFQSRDAQNNLNGFVRSSSVFVKEDASSISTVQQIDLVA